MKELKELADRLEKAAQRSTDLGVKAGLMQSVCMAYELINELLLKELQVKSN